MNNRKLLTLRSSYKESEVKLEDFRVSWFRVKNKSIYCDFDMFFYSYTLLVFLVIIYCQPTIITKKE